MREQILASGAILKIQMAPYRPAKTLFDAIVREAKSSNISFDTELDVNFIKNICLGVVSSPEVEKSLWPCLAHCTYDGLRINEDTFNSLQAREDFLEICMEVGKENVLPFAKHLYAKLLPQLEAMGLSLA